MRLNPEHRTAPPKRLRSHEVLATPETTSDAGAKQLAHRAADLLRMYPEKIWPVRLETGKLLASFAFPELVPTLFPDPMREAATFSDFLRKEKNKEFFPDSTCLVRLATVKLLTGKIPVKTRIPKVTESSLRNKKMMDSISQKDVVRRWAVFALLFPELREEISEAARVQEEEVFKNVDQEVLDPNRESPSTGAYFRLINPGAAVALQKIAGRHRAAWEEQVKYVLSPEIVGKYTNRGFNFNINRALLATAGLEMLLAQEASITPDGKIHVVATSKILGAPKPLPERDVTV